MKELGEALKAIFDKFSNFFDILDLSFFVSGVVSLGALYYWVQRLGAKLALLPPVGTRVVVGVVGSYVLGLVCFATGRFVRTNLARSRSGESRFDTLFPETLKAHGLDTTELVSEYMGRRSGGLDVNRRLYTRLWAEVRQSEALKASFALLNRYWVMSATYDGLATALCIWASVPPALAISAELSWPGAFLAISVLLVLALACLREAGRYNEHQVEELAATIAYKLSASPALEQPASPTVSDASPAARAGDAAAG